MAKRAVADKQSWPADNVVRRPVADLIPYARNARTHSETQVAQIAASIREWGWTTPVLIDPEGGIIAGHGRVMAAQKLGITEVPTMVAAGWTESQKRAYVLADNQLAVNAGWDMELLKIELGDLADVDFNIDLIGFDEAFLANMNGAFLEEADQEQQWAGMPEYEGLEPSFRKIVVSFDDQHSVDQFAALIGQAIAEKTKSIWYPHKERRDLEALRWDDDGGDDG